MSVVTQRINMDRAGNRLRGEAWLGLSYALIDLTRVALASLGQGRYDGPWVTGLTIVSGILLLSGGIGILRRRTWAPRVWLGAVLVVVMQIGLSFGVGLARTSSPPLARVALLAVLAACAATILVRDAWASQNAYTSAT